MKKNDTDPRLSGDPRPPPVSAISADDRPGRQIHNSHRPSRWTPIFPVPAGTPAPRFTHSHRGQAQEHFQIQDADNSTLGYVCTFIKSTGEAIELSLTWCVNPEGEHAWRWVQFPKLRPLYGLPELEAAPAGAVLVVFSCRAAAAARELLPMAVAVSWPGGVRNIDDVHWTPLRGRVVYVLPDAGRSKAAKRIARTLAGFDCIVQIVDVDRDPLPLGWSLAEAHAAKWTEGQAWVWLKERTKMGDAEGKGASLPPIEQPGGADIEGALPVIDWREGELPRIVDEAERALLAGNVRLFERAGMLVRCVKRKASTVRQFKRPPGSLGLLMVDKTFLVETLTRVAVWRRWDQRREEFRLTNAPEKVAETYLARSGHWKLPALRAVISTPTLRPDGTLLQEPGYDAATQVWYDPLGARFPRVKDEPTLNDATEALDVLLDAFKTFPFQDRVDLSVALSLALTALVRRSLPSAPLGGITAPAARSGKTKLAHCIAILAMGTPAPAMSFPAKEEEAAKSALALLLDGDAAALIDNITRPLHGDWLCTILTEEEFKQRELGLSKLVRVPTNVLFLATGNHLTIVGDLRSRSLLCRLDAKVERPEERKFAYDAVDHFLVNRGELVAAGLTIMRAFIAQRVKVEDIEVGPWGGFERWSAMVRAPLMWLGCKDPRLSHEALMEEDQEHADLMRMIEAWHAVFRGEGATAREAIARVNSAVTGEDENILGNVLRDVAKDKGGIIENQRLGSWMRRHSKQRINGKQIVKAGERDHAVMWKVETVDTT